MAEQATARHLERNRDLSFGTTPVTALPILRCTQRALIDLAQRRSTTLGHIVRVVEYDPNLALGLFLAVNRELSQSARELADTIHRALLVFGTARFLDLAKSHLTVEQTLNKKSQAAIRHKMARSFLAARVASALAKMYRRPDVKAVFAAAYCSDAASYGRKLIKLTDSKLSTRHFALYTPGLSRTAEDSGDPGRLIELSRSFAKRVSSGWDDTELDPLYDRLAELWDGDPEHIERRLKQVVVETARLSRHFDCPLAAKHLMSPGPRPIRKSLPAAVVPNAPAAPVDPAEDPIARALSAEPQSVYGIEECRRRIGRAIRDLEKISLSDGGRTRIIPYTLRTMTAILPVEKALFIAHDKHGRLNARLKFAENQEPITCNIPFDRAQNPCLERILGDNMPAKLEPGDLQQLDHTLRHFVGTQVAFCFPMVVGRPIGLILAQVERSLDRQDHTYFELFLALMSRATESLSAASGKTAND